MGFKISCLFLLVATIAMIEGASVGSPFYAMPFDSGAVMNFPSNFMKSLNIPLSNVQTVYSSSGNGIPGGAFIVSSGGGGPGTNGMAVSQVFRSEVGPDGKEVTERSGGGFVQSDGKYQYFTL